jgi:formylglycine-generating enzyme required for sulfatase activity
MLEEEEARRQSDFTETLTNGVELEMIAVPAGEFMMGSNESK